MINSPDFPTLEVDLAAVSRNYARLKARLKGAGCAAVVKANGYGLGVAEIAQALQRAGCGVFFVATLAEGIELRGVLPQAEIYVFHGVRADEAKDFLHHRLLPVLSDRGQIERWNKAGPCALHIDTGMCRLGIDPAEAAGAAEMLRGAELRLVMSHLACADEPDHPQNARQLAAFRDAALHFPGVPASLANSSGVFLGDSYHFDLARPGCSLYGISPDTARDNPMENVVTLSAPVLQYRTLAAPATVGYGATATAAAGRTLATVELGYADGLQRVLGNRGFAYAAGLRVPLIGRVSMDMVSVDVTDVPAGQRDGRLRVVFIGNDQPVDLVAKAAGTIGYELFTGLGRRVRRIYRD